MRLVMLVCVLGLSIGFDQAMGGEELAVFPSTMAIQGREGRQTFFVERMIDGRAVGSIEEGVAFAVSNPAICRVDGRTVVPLANGEAVVTASQGTMTASFTVRVTGMDQPFAWSFRHHVQSVMAKQGCNSGACHGAAAGKRGFKLSLRGYDAPG